MPLDRQTRVYVAGHRGLVGSALIRLLHREGFTDIVSAPRGEVDLRDPSAVAAFFARTRPHVVILAAAKVGGIQANRTLPATFLFDNLMIQNNVIEQSRLHQVERFVFLGSSCIYPRECPQPMREEHLLTGPLEPTNEGYALAKIAGLRLAQYYQAQHGLASLCPIPCNLYGPNDSFDPHHSHVLSSLVRRFVDAAESGADTVTLWGTGMARREFLHVDDLARAVLFLLEHHDSPQAINVGSGTDVSIRELAEQVAAAAGYHGQVTWDTDMPDGMLRKCLDVSRMKAMGFTPRIDLSTGIAQVITEYRALKRAG